MNFINKRNFQVIKLLVITLGLVGTSFSYAQPADTSKDKTTAFASCYNTCRAEVKKWCIEHADKKDACPRKGGAHAKCTSNCQK